MTGLAKISPLRIKNPSYSARYFRRRYHSDPEWREMYKARRRGYHKQWNPDAISRIPIGKPKKGKKYCFKCKKWKKRDRFYKNKNAEKGMETHYSPCIECRTAAWHRKKNAA